MIQWYAAKEIFKGQLKNWFGSSNAEQEEYKSPTLAFKASGRRKCEQIPAEKAKQKAGSRRGKLGDTISTRLGLKGLTPL